MYAIPFVSKARKRCRDWALEQAVHSSLARPSNPPLHRLRQHILHKPMPKRLPSSNPDDVHIDEGYSMTRTEAPKERGGRLCLNCARTHPEFPRTNRCQMVTFGGRWHKDNERTMDIDDGTPDHSQLGTPNLFARTIDKCTALSKIESVVWCQWEAPLSLTEDKVPGGFGVIDAFELKEALVASQ